MTDFQIIFQYVRRTFPGNALEIHRTDNGGAVVMDADGRYLVYFIDRETGRILNDAAYPDEYRLWRCS